MFDEIGWEKTRGGSGEYGQWYYLIYLLPGGVAMLLLLLSAAGGGGRHHRAAAGHRVGGGHRHGGPKHQPPKGAGAKAAGAPNMAQQIVAYFGVGRVPGPFVWGSFLLGWGPFGFWGTRLWQDALDRPGLSVIPSFVTALAGALGMAKLTGELGARLALFVGADRKGRLYSRQSRLLSSWLWTMPVRYQTAPRFCQTKYTSY